jgi:hypothetical protein
MQRARCSTILALLALAVPALARAQAFEGTVSYQLKGAEEGQFIQSYKGGRVRTEITTKGHAAVMLMEAGTMTMLMPDQKMYMTMNLKDMAARMSGMGGRNQEHDAGTPPKITDEGTKETIAGHTCQNYLMGDKQDIEACVATGMGFFMMGSNPMAMGGGGGSMANASALANNPEYAKFFKNGFFPLRLSKVEGGKKQVMMEATQVEAKSLDASLFQVPADYKEMKMPGMH